MLRHGVSAMDAAPIDLLLRGGVSRRGQQAHAQGDGGNRLEETLHSLAHPEQLPQRLSHGFSLPATPKTYIATMGYVTFLSRCVNYREPAQPCAATRSALLC